MPRKRNNSHTPKSSSSSITSDGEEDQPSFLVDAEELPVTVEEDESEDVVAEEEAVAEHEPKVVGHIW